MKTIWCIACQLVCITSIWSQTQLAPKKNIQANRTDEKIILDARLDESAWAGAQPASNFVFFYPTPGNKASQNTQVKLLYNDNALYIGAICYDTHPDSIYHRLCKRDQLENTDFFSIVIDTYRDGQNAVKFGVTPDNVQFDTKFSLANADPNNGNNDGEDLSWDAVWRSAARLTDEGWALEMEIPYSAIRFPKKEVQQWSVNFFRSVKRNGENDSWNEINAKISGTLSQMGILDGISHIKAPLRLSATPFLALYANNLYNQTYPKDAGWSYPWSAGMDLKYGINEAFTLDATIIPDFGQVRSDKNVLNLSPFEIKFDENRPFFTEGTELFNKGGLFYSRRVGSSAPLLNATKISGRSSKGLGIGLFNAMEQATYSTVIEEGAEKRVEESPFTDKNIVVLDQNLPHNSSVTLISTNVLRSGAATDANVTGFLFNLKNKSQSYAMNGRVVASNRFSESGLESGYTASLNASKNSGNFLWGSEFNLESDRYNPNDLGFLFSPNELTYLLWTNYNRYKPWWKLNNFWTSAWVYNGALYKPFGAWTNTIFGFNFGGNTLNFHNFGFNSNYTPWGERDYYEPRSLDFIHYYQLPASYYLRFWYSSDQRKPVVLDIAAGSRVYGEHRRHYNNASIGLQWRISSKCTVGFSVGNEWGSNDVGGLGTRDHLKEEALGYDQVGADDLLMGRRDLFGFDNTLNLTYSFNNKMNLSFYCRHYWQKVNYKHFYRLDEDGKLQYTPYSGRSDSGESLYDLAANYFNIDMVYTWRFAPGSDLLLVYKNGASHLDTGYNSDHNYGHNFRQLRHFEGANNFSLKILYYLDYEKMRKWL